MGDLADLLMPKLGLTMTEGTVARWLVAPGQRFSAGDVIVVIETDKIANEVEAPAPGEMADLLSPEGDVVPVGVPIARWRLEGVGVVDRPATEMASAQRTNEHSGVAQQDVTALPPARRPSQRIIATPYARRLARESGLDLATIAGSGPRGRIKAADVLHGKDTRATSRQLTAIAPVAEQAIRTAVSREALSFVSADVDVGALRALDSRLAGSGGRAFERLTYVVLACTKALADDGDGAVRIGFERGKKLTAVEGSAHDTLSAMAARMARALPDGDGGDLAIFIVDGTVRLFVPAIPHGWRVTLGVGGVRAPRGDAATHEMTLALSYDSNALDHGAAARLLGRIAALLEEPLHLLAI